ncbi:MAG: outer membrane protein assembly factor BamA [Planctomycetes bacterium]|nr:outer membrane protein assembly factor BamA [Planctomycetota bacterium]
MPRTMFAWLVAIALAPQAAAFAQESWEGKVIEESPTPQGFHLIRFANVASTLHARKGNTYTLERRDEDVKALIATNFFDDVRIHVTPGQRGDHIRVTIKVRETPLVEDILFDGLAALSPSDLLAKLSLKPGERLSPHRLKLDGDALREEYIAKGYPFSSIREEITPSDHGVTLRWKILEGPLVTVREIVFTGDTTLGNDVKDYLLTKEPGSFLFIPGGSHPFVMRHVEEDLKRIANFYQEAGHLDVTPGRRVFLEDLLFTDDKTEVTVKIHIDAGPRYRIRSLRFEENQLFTSEELARWVSSAPDTDYAPGVIRRDVAVLRAKYGERAYILAQVVPRTLVDFEKHELDLTFVIDEGVEMRVGRIRIDGNTRTRSDVILRELKGFAPGEKFNSELLRRGLMRLRSRGYFEPQDGIDARLEEGVAPGEADVVIDVKEGKTRNINFGGGYSSSLGVVGILKLDWDNFDLADLPHSLGDFLDGNAFTGGGQALSLQFMPSARRQSFTVAFREPYLFGAEVGLNARAYSTQTAREDWDEERWGGALSLDKRISDFRLEVAFKGFQVDIDDIGSSAPGTIRSLEGDSVLFSIAPGLVFDTRDDPLMPTEGTKLALFYERAGGFLPGDFDFWKTSFEADAYLTLLETESRLRHVLQFNFTFGVAGDDAPFFERFTAGGSNSIRGFAPRGIGPRENGDSIGGNAFALASAEYSFPIFDTVLRGAAFYDIADLTSDLTDMPHDKWRQSVGVGLRLRIPQMGNVPIALDFALPLTRQDDDERQTVTVELGTRF